MNTISTNKGIRKKLLKYSFDLESIVCMCFMNTFQQNTPFPEMPTAPMDKALLKHLDQSESAPTSFGVEGQYCSKMSDRLK